MSMFQKATKKKSKLRLALFGPSGSGKTYTALSLATGIGGRIAMIDTEYGSASKYADRFDFDTAPALNPSIDELIGIMEGAREYDVLIIDSLSHPWQELLEEIDQLAKAKYRGNTWSAWSDGTPKQKRLVRSILGFPGHIIATMRSKTEWTTVDRNGKKTPERVGLAPEQGKGIEYEFDMLMEISTDHIVNVIKDRTGKFQDKLVDKPGAKFGTEIAAWLNEGAEPEPTFDEIILELGNLMASWSDEEKAPFRTRAETTRKSDMAGWKDLLDAVRKANQERIKTKAGPPPSAGAGDEKPASSPDSASGEEEFPDDIPWGNNGQGSGAAGADQEYATELF